MLPFKHGTTHASSEHWHHKVWVREEITKVVTEEGKYDLFSWTRTRGLKDW